MRCSNPRFFSLSCTGSGGNREVNATSAIPLVAKRTASEFAPACNLHPPLMDRIACLYRSASGSRGAIERFSRAWTSFSQDGNRNIRVELAPGSGDPVKIDEFAPTIVQANATRAGRGDTNVSSPRTKPRIASRRGRASDEGLLRQRPPASGKICRPTFLTIALGSKQQRPSPNRPFARHPPRGDAYRHAQRPQRDRGTPVHRSGRLSHPVSIAHKWPPVPVAILGHFE